MIQILTKLKTMPNFQEQIVIDLDNVFFNAPQKEFVTLHKIQGIMGTVSEVHECECIVDSERYFERMVKDKVEGVSLNGLVFFIKESHWLEKFKRIPKVNSTLKFDGELYLVVAIAADMGSLEFTLEARRGHN